MFSKKELLSEIVYSIYFCMQSHLLLVLKNVFTLLFQVLILSTIFVKCHGQALGLDLRDITKKDTNERCVDKIVFVNETEYDEVITCDHTYSEKCHATFKTDFEPSQEQECSESFTKNCFIEFKDVATEEDIEFCHTPMVIKNHKLLSHCKIFRQINFDREKVDFTEFLLKSV